MSNHLAIATVTATLQRLLQSAIQGDVEGARVTTVRPDAIGTVPARCSRERRTGDRPRAALLDRAAQRRRRRGIEP